MSPFTTIASPGERLLEQRPGHPTRALEPGKHRRRRGATYFPDDVRERLEQVSPQEVLTADGVAVKVTAVIRWSVIDAVQFTEHTAQPLAVVYLAVQVTLRDALVGVPVEEALTAVRGLGPSLTATARAAAETVGIEVSDVAVKDVMLPVELRTAYASLVTAKQQAQVQLEHARAETAALRSLANAAKLLDDHPALARMRIVQAMPYGSTLKVSLDSEQTPQ